MRAHSEDLFRLVYASRATLTGTPQFEELTRNIIATSQRNNASVGVTGLLLAHRGSFVQVLEGSRRNVSQIFAVIGRDLRHVELSVLFGDKVGERLFGRWSMCAQTITPQALPALQALDLQGDFDPHELEGHTAVQLLQALSGIPAVSQLPTQAERARA